MLTPSTTISRNRHVSKIKHDAHQMTADSSTVWPVPGLGFFATFELILGSVAEACQACSIIEDPQAQDHM